VTLSAELDALLTVQEHDGALDRLRHRRATLPERDALARGESDAAALAGRVAGIREQRDVIAGDEQKIEDETKRLAEKAAEVEATMYSGAVSSPRELQAMQADVEQLRRHQRNLENRELELMEAREPLDAALAELEAEGAALGATLERLRITVAEAEAVIDAEATDELAKRAAAASGIDAALVTEYERCRAQARGAGVARLVGNTCQGCHLSIPATEVERIKKAADGTLAHCDNCGCILVP
jgi:uncharacterized protein